MKTIGVVTVARSDFGIYKPILDRIKAAPSMKLHLIVSGMHCSPQFGLTREHILEEGFEIGDQFEMLLSSDTSEAIAKSMGLGIVGFAQSYARQRPDILLTLGDRFEMFSAVAAAVPSNIPIAHIHGGETTEGAIDEVLRHAITKMSHLHFVSTEVYARRVIQMGEEPWRVHVSGAPALDNLRTMDLLDSDELSKRVGLELDKSPLLVTYHPVTREHEATSEQIHELLIALETFDLPVVFTYPNADTSGHLIIQAIDQYVEGHQYATVCTNLGTQAYFSLMKYAAAMVGNSSSGIIEAASFELPVVNIGNRQRGRLQGPNVINAHPQRTSIISAIERAITPSFNHSLIDTLNLYGAGNAAERVVEIIDKVELNQRLIAKPFYDLPSG